MTDGRLKRLFGEIETRRSITRVSYALAFCWGGSATLAWLVNAVFRGNGVVQGWALATVIALALASSLVVWAKMRKRSLDPRKLAATVESHFPDLDGRLITVVQQQPVDNSDLNYFQARLLSEVIEHNSRHDWDQVYPAARAGLARAVQLVAFCLLLATIWLQWPAGSAELASPLSEAESGITVQPGDISIERGSSLAILARFAMVPPSAANLVILQPGATNRIIPLVRNLSDPVFGASLPRVESGFEYYVESGGEKSRNFRVEVFEYPQLTRSDVDIIFPEYTGLKPKKLENTRRISGVEGSIASIALELNKPVVSALLVPRVTNTQTAAINLVVEADRARATLNGFALREKQTYELRLVDADGRTNKAAEQFVFDALKNRPPEMKLTQPTGDIRPSPLEEVSFRGTAWDDFGVRSFGIGYTVAGNITEEVELGRNVPSGERRSFDYLLRLEELGVEPDQLVAWFSWSEDYGPDGKPRRTYGDLYFAEIRPFEELFREGQGGDNSGEGQDSAGDQSGERGSQSGRLAELQKQIISATWNLQRGATNTGRNDNRGRSKRPDQQSSGTHRNRFEGRFGFFGAIGLNALIARADERVAPATGERDQVAHSPSFSVKGDIDVVLETQTRALAQAREALASQQDPQRAALWRAAIQEMERVLRVLEVSHDSSSLTEALAAQHTAYQALLKLQERDYQVSRSRRSQGQQSGRQQQMQSQLSQLELNQSENRYEMKRQAQQQQNRQRREELQVISRLEELAKRQQALNERLNELRAELQKAKDEAQREALRRQLKRLQEEQQEMLKDLDDVQQRMQQPENQSRMADQQKQLEQAREELQKAADAAQEGAVSQALASGTRAQRQLQETRDQLQRQSSGQFSEELRELRQEARELVRGQQQLLEQMRNEGQNASKRLSNSPERQRLLNGLANQMQRLTNLVNNVTEISEQTESVEPLVSRELYDSLRTFTQDTVRDAQELQDELLSKGQMSRDLYERFQDSVTPGSIKLFDAVGELTRMDIMSAAAEAATTTQSRLEGLKRGVGRAAERVLGDETEALRLAKDELDRLNKVLQDEITSGEQQAVAEASNRPATDINAQTGQGGAPGTNQLQASEIKKTTGEAESKGERTQLSRVDPEQTRQARPESDPGTATESNNQSSSTTDDRDAQTATTRESAQDSQSPGNSPGNQALQRMELGNESGSATGSNSAVGPIAGDGFSSWSDQLRDVEQMVDMPELRQGLSAARDRARTWRRLTREQQMPPDWAVIRLEVLSPLTEVRDRIAEELRRRGASEVLVPLDRDPVPSRYSDLVKRYYEELGKSK